MDDRQMIQVLSLGRIAIGTMLSLAPSWCMRRLTGTDHADAATRWSARGLGARDAAIGVGTLVTLENDGNVRGWLEAAIVADAADTVSTLANFGEMGTWRRWLWLASSAGAVVVGAQLVSQLED